MQEKTSQDANLILKKLKSVLKIRTDIELSGLLNVKPNTISSWKKRNTLDYSGIMAVCEWHGLDLNDIFYNKSNSKSHDSATEGTLLVSRESQYQYCTDSENNLETLPEFSFPFLKGEISRAFQVTGNNMFPLIEENAYVICTETDIDKIRHNDLVVLISQQKGIFINRLRFLPGDESSFELTNDYIDNHNIVIKKAEINEIWSIKGVLSYDMGNNNKLKYFNDNLKIMDKVLSIIQ